MSDLPNDTTPEGSRRPDQDTAPGQGWTPATDAGRDEGEHAGGARKPSAEPKTAKTAKTAQTETDAAG
jgi:hypothetical protein